MAHLRTLAKAYYHAKTFLLTQGFCEEIDWQYDVSLDRLLVQDFLSEAAWVILNSGMRESIIRKLFPNFLRLFDNFQSTQWIIDNKEECRTNALNIFSHKGKIEAILVMIAFVNENGFEYTRDCIRSRGFEFISTFPYFGNATSFHLAKNIGLSIGKPDRHLQRVAKLLGYEDMQKLCLDISELTDEPIPVVDLVIWRYATIKYQRIEQFSRIYLKLNTFEGNA